MKGGKYMGRAIIKNAMSEDFCGQEVIVIDEVSDSDKKKMFNKNTSEKRFFWVETEDGKTLWKSDETLKFL